MSDDQEDGPVATAHRFEEAARDLLRSTHEIPHPSDVHEVLGALKNSQGTLTQVYEQLASWHSQVVQGIHHAGEEGTNPFDSPSWLRAEFALREALHYSANAVDALEHARSANAIADWFDEIRVDEE